MTGVLRRREFVVTVRLGPRRSGEKRMFLTLRGFGYTR
ncbi:hypothetical protein EBESD8_25130 [Rhodococcus aetherivorans]|nr:hypothetical protein EBESD8_25130 [Rhodococcus aetherivorans]